MVSGMRAALAKRCDHKKTPGSRPAFSFTKRKPHAVSAPPQSELHTDAQTDDHRIDAQPAERLTAKRRVRMHPDLLDVRVHEQRLGDLHVDACLQRRAET